MSVPFTRTLPYVLREQLIREPLRTLSGRVVSVPDADHVQVDLQGAQLTIPRLTSYGSPVTGEPCFVLTSSLFTIALGTVGGVAGGTGPQGPPGASVLGAARNPTAADGNNGDWWINTATGQLYGPKAGGAWPGTPALSMIGPQGPQGAQGPAGPGVAAGGATGNVLSKASAADYDTHWTAAPPPGGAAGGDLGGSYPNPTVKQAAGPAFPVLDPASAGAVRISSDGGWPYIVLACPGSGGGGAGTTYRGGPAGSAADWDIYTQEGSEGLRFYSGELGADVVQLSKARLSATVPIIGTTSVICGSGAPGAGVGVDGCVYLDTASLRFWGPKAAGAWPAQPFGRLMPLNPTYAQLMAG